MSLSVQEASFEGLSGVSLTEITLVPKDADTLLALKMKTSVSIWHLAGGTIGNFRSSKRSGTSAKSKNFASFLRKKKKDPANENKRDYAAFATLFLKY
jgi:hypothetical protein